MPATLGAPLYGRLTDITVGKKADVGSDEGAGGSTATGQIGPGDLRQAINRTLNQFKNGWTLRTGQLTPAGWQFGARIDFEVGTTNQDDVDQAVIKLYNLASLSRSILGKGSPIILRSGYVNVFESIFTGIVQKVEDDYSKVDIVTKLSCDIEAEKFFARGASGSFPSGMLITDVAKEIIKATGVPIGLIAYSSQKLTSPLALDPNDTMRTHLNRLAEMIDYSLKFEHGRVYFVPKDFSIQPELGWAGIPGFLLTSATGLISAEKVEASETEDFDLKLKTLLIPMMRTDMLVYVKTSRIQAVYRVERIRYISSGRNHRCECECVEVKGEVNF